MPTHRKSPPRRARKQLKAELERLSVPENTRPARDERAAETSQAAAEPEAENERIRRMIEASYT